MAEGGPRARKRRMIARVVADIGARLFAVNGQIAGLQREREELIDLDRRMRGLLAALGTNDSAPPADDREGARLAG